MINILTELHRLKEILSMVRNSVPLKGDFGYCHENVQLNYPLRIDTPKNVFLYENTKVRDGVRIINSPKEKVIVKKYTAIASNTTIVTSNHTSTVYIPHILLGSSHVNDKSSDIIIEEDVWVGTGAKLLAGTKLNRGCIVGAGAMVNKEIPPYAVVVGSPAKIISVKFSIEQIVEHEKALYPEEERFSREFLEDLFEKYYVDKKVYGKTSLIDASIEQRINEVKRRIHFVDWKEKTSAH